MHSSAQYPLPLQHVPPPAEIVRRVTCPGSDEQPCPAHAWWYEGRRSGAGAGRRRLRCEVCNQNLRNEAKRRPRRSA